ncbi:hypothetical protein BDD12DRAFT_808314 [Trichophaea hybrida]|nr:hypothetical protein BDD12DRAFT_808314 [Trichophaea hybrida]
MFSHQAVRELDRQRGSWCDIDPNTMNLPDGATKSAQKVMARMVVANVAHGMLLTQTGVAFSVGQSVSNLLAGISGYEAYSRSLPQTAPTKNFERILVEVVSDDQREALHMDFKLAQEKSITECDLIEVHTGQKWLLRALIEGDLPNSVNLEDIRFKLANYVTNEVKNGCGLKLVHSYTS